MGIKDIQDIKDIKDIKDIAVIPVPAPDADDGKIVDLAQYRARAKRRERPAPTAHTVAHVIAFTTFTASRNPSNVPA